MINSLCTYLFRYGIADDDVECGVLCDVKILKNIIKQTDLVCTRSSPAKLRFEIPPVKATRISNVVHIRSKSKKNIYTEVNEALEEFRFYH